MIVLCQGCSLTGDIVTVEFCFKHCNGVVFMLCLCDMETCEGVVVRVLG